MEQTKQLSLGADLALSERVRFYGYSHTDMRIFCYDLADKIKALEQQLEFSGAADVRRWRDIATDLSNQLADAHAALAANAASQKKDSEKD